MIIITSMRQEREGMLGFNAVHFQSHQSESASSKEKGAILVETTMPIIVAHRWSQIKVSRPLDQFCSHIQESKYTPLFTEVNPDLYIF